MKIVFFGTSEFAVPSLLALINSEFKVVAIVTAPDKPSGRGQKINFSPIKQVGIVNNIPVLQPLSLRDDKFLEALSFYNADLQVVVAFRMLPRLVWKMSQFGTINLHASLLPEYRGAAPINWAIINGETMTGLTTFFINEKIDVGNIIYQEQEIIENKDTFGSLHDRLKIKGADLIIKTVKAIAMGVAPCIEQQVVEKLKLAPKIEKEHTKIDWRASAIDIYNLIRGMSPLPGVVAYISDIMCKIYNSELCSENLSKKLSPGEIYTNNRDFLLVGTGDLPIFINSLQLPSKKILDIKAFLAGNKFD